MSERLSKALVPVGLGLLAIAATAHGAHAAAGVKASLSKGVLTVSGTRQDEIIAVRLKPGDATVLEVDVGGDGRAEFAFARSRFTAVVVEGREGNDTLIADESLGAFTDTERTTLSGESGDDSLIGAHFSEQLLGGTGNDVLDGGTQADRVDGGDGADVVLWSPGGGSDVVVGGAGSDRLQFSGANIAEAIGVTAAAGHVTLTRDIAGVTLDLTQLETIDVRASGGADTLTVGDLTGTDLKLLRADIAAADGTDDGLSDVIAVPAGATLGHDGSTPTVDVSTTQVRVTGAGAGDVIRATGTTATDVVHVAGTSGGDAITVFRDVNDVAVDGATAGLAVRLSGIDLIDVDLGAGDDQFGVVGDLASVTRLDVDGQDGMDVLSGGNGPDALTGGSGPDVIDGNQGSDVVSAGDGDDAVQWDPGDGSDAVTGGTGTDRLMFNGANIGETFGFSALGDHVVLSRDVAAISLDLDELEAVDLRTFGGVDAVHVDDLTGTDLTMITTDLAATAGGDDLAADTLHVPPGVTVGQDGGAALVSGLGARVRIVGGAVGDQIAITGMTLSDVAFVAGTAGPDSIIVLRESSTVADVVVDGAAAGMPVRMTGIDVVDVDLGAGDDQFSTIGDVSITRLDVDGQDGSDVLRGGLGADVIAGGPGDDLLVGGRGNDVLTGGDGADVVTWDPGDGNDTFDGGADIDRLTFNGANIGETIRLTPVANRVHLTRNVAAIELDFAGIESVQARVLGGADVVTVDDLSGTDVGEVVLDLAAVGGMGDATPDTVVVNGSNVADVIAVGDDGPAVTVGGLRAAIRITGAEPTLDMLAVDGLGGADTITATPSASSLIVLQLIP